MRRYFLGLAAGYSGKQVARQLFIRGRRRDCDELCDFLQGKYGPSVDSRAILYKNGRSALAAVLAAYFEPGDRVLITGFTCYAVVEAVEAARLKPVFADIDENLNAKLEVPHDVKGIIVQNTLGRAADIAQIERIARKHDLVIIEDLAHSAGIQYADGREAGTVGAGVAWSFGKDKAIDTVSGGAAIFRAPRKNEIIEPSLRPRLSDHLRARFYPLFGLICRKLTWVHLGGALMRFLIKIHFVERSADNKLDLTRRISKFEARLAREQFSNLQNSPIREAFFVRDREKCLAELRQAGYYLDGFWYEKPVAPQRYYKRAHFSEKACPQAVFAAEHILNLPSRYYKKADLAKARKIIKKYELKEGDFG